MTAIKHYTATVYIFSDGQPRKTLLVHHRKFNKWTPPGGHQEDYENAVEAAIREVHEETGLDIADYFSPSETIGKGVYLPVPKRMLEVRVPARADEPEHYHLDMQYYVTIPEQAVSHSTEESYDIGWFTLEEAEKLPSFTDIPPTLRQEMTA